MIEEVAGQMSERWGGKTLSTLRDEAVLEENGTVFESIRVDNGPRLLLIICVTNPEQIEMIESAVTLDDNIPPSDWATSTLRDMVLRTIEAGGLTYEDLRDAYAKRIAVALCATGPDSMRILETLFKMPA